MLRARTLGDTVDVVRAGLEHAAPAIAFYSGGTTGTPRPRRHATELLEQEIAVLAEFFSDRRRVIVTVPVHHIYGFLFGVLLPHALDVPAVDAQGTFLSGDRTPRAGDLVVSVPFLWERLQPAIGRWGSDVWGTSSTAPLPEHVAAACCRAGLARFVEIYGSSETAGIGSRDRCAGEGPFALFPYWRSVGEASLAGGPEHVLLRDPPGGGDPIRYDIPDRLHWHDDRHIEPRGRRDAVVQVGGENVDLEELRRRIVETVPACAECAVRLGDDGRIRAFLTPASNEELTSEGAHRVLSKRFTAAALPTSITIGAELPRDATGQGGPAAW